MQRQGAKTATEKNSNVTFGESRMVSSVVPSMIKIDFLALFLKFISLREISDLLVCSVIKYSSFYRLLRPAEMAMLVPVSTRSPVSIHT